jgi:hypothetical protein
MKIPAYDIFSGRFAGGDAEWIEAVEGLGDATARMQELAANTPGSYFVFSIETHEIVASINTLQSRTENQERSCERCEQAG